MTQEFSCSQNVHVNGSWGTNPCSRKGKVLDQGKWWCTQHSPAKKAERQQQSDDRYKATTKRWAEEWSIKVYNQDAGDYCRALGLTIEDLRQ